MGNNEKGHGCGTASVRLFCPQILTPFRSSRRRIWNKIPASTKGSPGDRLMSTSLCYSCFSRTSWPAHSKAARLIQDQSTERLETRGRERGWGGGPGCLLPTGAGGPTEAGIRSRPWAPESSPNTASWCPGRWGGGALLGGRCQKPGSQPVAELALCSSPEANNAGVQGCFSRSEAGSQ